MKRSGRTTGARAAAQSLALAAVLAASGIVAGTASASGERPASPQAAPVQLAYICRSPSRPEHVAAQVIVTFPATGKVGKPVQSSPARVVLTVPRAALSPLLKLHAATITGTVRLAVGIAAGGKSGKAAWPKLAVAATPVPAKGGLRLTAAGPVPAITPTAPGEATVTAAGLVLVITPHLAPSTGLTGLSSTPDAPSAVHLGCALLPGQNATLATVLVTGRPSGRPARHVTAKSPCPPLPKGGLKLNPRFPPPPPPPGSTVGSSPEAGCAYTTGFPDVRKLKGAALLQPGLTNVDLFVKTAFDSGKANYAQFDNAAQLMYRGKHEFPPSTATFLTFGFVPTTATIVLKEIGTINIFAIGPEDATRCHPPGSCPTIATVSSRLEIQISPVAKINGVPLNLGSHCRTVHPFDAILTGSSASNPPYIVTTGGPLTGLVNIPHFTGCGVGDNLDPIFNAAISGPQNFNLLTQGSVCFLLGGGTCPPPKPTPLRKVSF